MAHDKPKRLRIGLMDEGEDAAPPPRLPYTAAARNDLSGNQRDGTCAHMAPRELFRWYQAKLRAYDDCAQLAQEHRADPAFVAACQALAGLASEACMHAELAWLADLKKNGLDDGG